MGLEDYPPRKQIQQQQQSTIRSKLKILLLLVSSNLLTFFLFSPNSLRIPWSDRVPRIHLWDSEALLRELNSTQVHLAQTQSDLSDLQRRLLTSNSLLETLLTELGRIHGDSSSSSSSDSDWQESLSGELKLAVGPHKLPLGFTSQLGSDELFPSLGSTCRRFPDELAQYMSYPVGGECPVDDVFAQILMLKGCEPLPRRRCHPKTPTNFVPLPLPASLWSIPRTQASSGTPIPARTTPAL
ncbi:hypothetical protein HPP92_004085 [Vanilla planifolia]|uniref:Uncharacterized protein n=1 Tax=Vanilla planifolia TaxID=51239 RepID=A0A835S7F2_VANPL|nr:hypothetical protein HPP92_004510 [Vanilla planifolia]KAG0504013.1 hypothetical protein HPP92_004085 [Vanilla planifolia]